MRISDWSSDVCSSDVRFNAEGPDGLIDRKAPGASPLLDEEHRRALAQIVEDGPIPAAHGVVRWRLLDLAQGVWDGFSLPIRPMTLSSELSGVASCRERMGKCEENGGVGRRLNK